MTKRLQNLFLQKNESVSSLKIYLRLDNYADAMTTSGEFLSVEGLSVWTKYSKEGEGNNHAWFDCYNGNIVVKNPDKEILGKMVAIAQKLHAQVQGDEGEIYE